jgi:hypothetical protein
MSDEPMTTPDDQQPENTAEFQEEHEPQMELRTEHLLQYTISLFAEQAWVHLGIRANPATGETNTDFAQARLAIDAIAALLPLAEGRFEAHAVRDLRNLLSSLQFNFVERYTPGS